MICAFAFAILASIGHLLNASNVTDQEKPSKSHISRIDPVDRGLSARAAVDLWEDRKSCLGSVLTSADRANGTDSEPTDTKTRRDVLGQL